MSVGLTISSAGAQPPPAPRRTEAKVTFMPFAYKWTYSSWSFVRSPGRSFSCTRILDAWYHCANSLFANRVNKIFAHLLSSVHPIYFIFSTFSVGFYVFFAHWVHLNGPPQPMVAVPLQIIHFYTLKSFPFFKDPHRNNEMINYYPKNLCESERERLGSIFWNIENCISKMNSNPLWLQKMNHWLNPLSLEIVIQNSSNTNWYQSLSPSKAD